MLFTLWLNFSSDSFYLKTGVVSFCLVLGKRCHLFADSILGEFKAIIFLPLQLQIQQLKQLKKKISVMLPDSTVKITFSHVVFQVCNMLNSVHNSEAKLVLQTADKLTSSG